MRMRIRIKIRAKKEYSNKSKERVWKAIIIR